jgi:hypothetical protein
LLLLCALEVAGRCEKHKDRLFANEFRRFVLFGSNRCYAKPKKPKMALKLRKQNQKKTKRNLNILLSGYNTKYIPFVLSLFALGKMSEGEQGNSSFFTHSTFSGESFINYGTPHEAQVEMGGSDDKFLLQPGMNCILFPPHNNI